MGDIGDGEQGDQMERFTSALVGFIAMAMVGCGNSSSPQLPPLVPVAEFTVSPVIGEAPLLVACTNLTEPADAAMHWQFGDGTITNDVHPVHTFDIPGTYDTVLIATNESGSSELVYSPVVVTGPLPPPSGPFPPGPDEIRPDDFCCYCEVLLKGPLHRDPPPTYLTRCSRNPVLIDIHRDMEFGL